MPSFEYKRLKYFDNIELFSSENENEYFPFHFHDFYCVSLITKGAEILKNTEQDFIAPSGTISITQVNEVHRNHSLDESGYSYKTIYINPSILQHFNNGKPVQALERVIYDQQLFAGFMNVFNKEGNKTNVLTHCFHELISHATIPHQKNSWNSGLCLIDEIIENHLNRPIDSNWLAQKFCMSKFHFIREFKKAKGVTPQTYIMLYRLAQAKKLLLDKVPISDIAYLYGFYDPSHFTNSFKKYFGVNPSDFSHTR